MGHAVTWLAEALCYKPVGRGSDSRRGGCISSVSLNLPAAVALGSTQASHRMSTRNLHGDKGWPARNADVTGV
jgi:hypothetical protein